MPRVDIVSALTVRLVNYLPSRLLFFLYSIHISVCGFHVLVAITLVTRGYELREQIAPSATSAIYRYIS